MEADRDRILRLRLARQGLVRRLPARRLEDAAAAGVGDVPPGSAAQALGARVTGLGPDALEAALDARRLARLHSLRGAVHVIAARDLAVFTTGVLPRTDDELRAFLGEGARTWLDREGVAALDALREVGDAARAALDGRTLTRDELHEEWRRRLPERLLPRCRGCGSHHVSPMLWRAAALTGATCVAGRAGNQALFARPDQWLGAARDETTPQDAAAELARRHVAWYGPSRPERLAAWAGIAPAQARAAWSLIEDELAEVEAAGQRAWILAGDRRALSSSPAARGIRLLPPGDPYLQQRDRDTLVPDGALRRRLWSGIGAPGAVLRDGRLAGLWRARRKGTVLHIAVDGLEPDLDGGELEGEAALVAAHRGAETARVTVAAG